MKIIRDEKIIQDIIRQYDLLQYFTKPDIHFFLAQFEKGEDLNYQLNPDQYFLFFLKGEINIRHINAEGNYLQIARIKKNAMLGDMEFVHPGIRQYQIEVEKDSLFACIALSQYRNQLYQDPKFLLSVARSITDKMERAAFDSDERDSLRKRLLYYMNERKNHDIKHVGKTCEDLHCSRRQLQRVLHDLCTEGILLKKGKGKYVLSESALKKSDTLPCI